MTFPPKNKTANSFCEAYTVVSFCWELFIPIFIVCHHLQGLLTASSADDGKRKTHEDIIIVENNHICHDDLVRDMLVKMQITYVLDKVVAVKFQRVIKEE